MFEETNPPESSRKPWLYVLLAAILLVLGAFFVDQHSELARQRELRDKDAKVQAWLDHANSQEAKDASREADCQDVAEKYGIESEVTKQKCPGTKIGKQLGF